MPGSWLRQDDLGEVEKRRFFWSPEATRSKAANQASLRDAKRRPVPGHAVPFRGPLARLICSKAAGLLRETGNRRFRPLGVSKTDGFGPGSGEPGCCLFRQHWCLPLSKHYHVSQKHVCNSVARLTVSETQITRFGDPEWVNLVKTNGFGDLPGGHAAKLRNRRPPGARIDVPCRDAQRQFAPQGTA